MKRILTVLLISSILVACTKTSENPAITEEELKAHMDYLATDSLKGRYPGTPEDIVAAEYILGEFAKAGLKTKVPYGIQEFEVIMSLKTGENNHFTFNDKQAVTGEDFSPAPFSASKRAAGEIVFTGYGFEIDSVEIQWNDYSGIEAKGKWVMVLRGNPELDSTSSPFDPYSNDRDKAMLAGDKGAAGLLLVSGEKYDPEDNLMSLDSRESAVSIPVIHITRNLADQLLEGTGKSISELESELNNKRIPVSLSTGTDLDAETEVLPDKKTTYNVIAKLEGSRPDKKEQFIVLGAHYDHLGMGGPGTSSRRRDTLAIHYGADDNASGVISMIEVAEELALSENKPERSILFIAFGAEELGLLGSKHYVENPSVPNENIDVMVNLDMVGRLRDNKLQVNGSGTAIQSEELVTRIASDSFNLVFSPEGFGASDHSSFYGKDIHVLFFSTGVHSEYHTPEDSEEKINYEGIIKTSELVSDIIMEIAQMDSLLTFQEAGPKERYSGRQSKTRVTLGIMPDVTSTDDTEGMGVEFVTPGKPADLGGMKKGDLIIAVEGKAVNSIYDYMYRLGKLSKGQLIIVTVKRDEEKLDLLIQL
jgi:aminopeptidase YwaD